MAQVGGSVHDWLWRTCFCSSTLAYRLKGLASSPETFARYLSKQTLFDSIQLSGVSAILDKNTNVKILRPLTRQLAFH